VESVSELIVAGRVVGEWVGFPVSSLVGEGEPVGHVIMTAFDMLGAKALARLSYEEGDLPGNELDWCIVGGVNWEPGGAEEPPYSGGIVS
jgi:hypothetical protein